MEEGSEFLEFIKVLGGKLEFLDGGDDDDIIVDISNRKMVKLYMVLDVSGFMRVIVVVEENFFLMVMLFFEECFILDYGVVK